MIQKKKENHLYLRLEHNEQESLVSILRPLSFCSDVILDLLSFENLRESILSFLKQINQTIIANGFCLVIVIKESSSISKIESLNIIPTLTEAEDYIQMEQIQRDLGV